MADDGAPAIPAFATRLLEVRTGRVKPIGKSDLLSAIDKAPRHGPVRLGPTGFEGDEQKEREFHGGPDKAALHYDADHYAAWADEFPVHAALFGPGGFGENLVSGGLDESTVCIGDRIRIGGALVEVSQPRQPCYKLNMRFEEPELSGAAERNGRTGWYYRVVEPGAVAAGDPVEIVERPHPDWTVRRIQHLIFDETPDRDATAAAAELPALASGLRTTFTRRLARDAGQR